MEESATFGVFTVAESKLESLVVMLTCMIIMTTKVRHVKTEIN